MNWGCDGVKIGGVGGGEGVGNRNGNKMRKDCFKKVNKIKEEQTAWNIHFIVGFFDTLILTYLKALI